MSFLNKVFTLTAAVSVSAMLTVGAAEAKNFKIAVGDSGGSSQEATGLGFKAALEDVRYL